MGLDFIILERRMEGLAIPLFGAMSRDSLPVVELLGFYEKGELVGLARPIYKALLEEGL
jgi:hypothetical protein